jgi:hypothetical protein
LSYRTKTIIQWQQAKIEEFSQKEQDLAAFAKALSHPARIAILQILAETECLYLRQDSRGVAACAIHRIAAFKRIKECGPDRWYS